MKLHPVIHRLEEQIAALKQCPWDADELPKKIKPAITGSVGIQLESRAADWIWPRFRLAKLFPKLAEIFDPRRLWSRHHEPHTIADALNHAVGHSLGFAARNIALAKDVAAKLGRVSFRDSVQ